MEVLLIRKVSYLRREAVARLWTSDTVWGFVQDFLTLFCMGGTIRRLWERKSVVGQRRESNARLVRKSVSLRAEITRPTNVTRQTLLKTCMHLWAFSSRLLK